MSYAYLALYTGDYLRDTRHLTPQKHGIYLMLLMYCWDTRGPAPIDEQECAGIANCRSSDEVDSLRYVLGRYFTRMEDGWYNQRIVKEIEKAEALSSVWSEAGKRGAQARVRLAQAKAKPRLKVGQASATTQTQTQTPLQTQTPVGEVELTESFHRTAGAAPCEPAKVIEKIPLNDGSEFYVTEEFVSEMQALYPVVDVPQTLREIRGWNLTHKAERKTRRGIESHINRWLAKEQNRG